MPFEPPIPELARDINDLPVSERAPSGTESVGTFRLYLSQAILGLGMQVRVRQDCLLLEDQADLQERCKKCRSLEVPIEPTDNQGINSRVFLQMR
jgi:hypothetical protein